MLARPRSVTRLVPLLRAAALALSTAALGAAAPAAFAQEQELEETAGSVPSPITVPAELPPTPVGFTVDASEAINAANETETIAETRKRHGTVEAIPEAKVDGLWEVHYVADGEPVALIVVDGEGAGILDEWTGPQVIWPMARGYDRQFGHVLNAPYVWIPLAAIFFFGLVDLRRPRRIAHLDLLVLLSFGISHVFFNTADIGVSVPLAYPPLLYLLARTIWVGFKGPGEGLRPSAPVTWLAIAIVFLCGFRIAINIADSGVIDVGYAGVVGADRLTNGEPVYGEGAFPPEVGPGDTYGPANYLAYVPFELALPWSGVWDDLPAAHGAAIFFDLAAIAGLFFLGRRLRRGRPGRDLGVMLAFAWAAYPYTAFVTQSNSNDSLVAAPVIWALVFFTSPAARAILLAVAATAKFAPLALVPLFASGERGLAGRLQKRRLPRPLWLRLAYFSTIFFATCAFMLVLPTADPGLATFWDRTLATQIGRESPFSIWGQVSGLQPLQTLVTVAVAGFAASLALVPSRRSLARVAALTAAVMIAIELTLDHWFYLYIPWFLGPLLAAIAMPRRRRRSRTAASPKAPARTRPAG